MRISRDDSSWKARGVVRRDFRHDHDAPNPERQRKKKPKKLTRRWCRGKEGREHEFDFTKRRCKNCGMKLWRTRTNSQRPQPTEEERERRLKCKTDGHQWMWADPEILRIPLGTHDESGPDKWFRDRISYYESKGYTIVFGKVYDSSDISRRLKEVWAIREPKTVGRVCRLCGKKDEGTRLNVEELWKYKTDEDN